MLTAGGRCTFAQLLVTGEVIARWYFAIAGPFATLPRAPLFAAKPPDPEAKHDQ
jgi:hypothetical protein